MRHLATLLAVTAVLVFAFDQSANAGPRGGGRGGASRGGTSAGKSPSRTSTTPSKSLGGGGAFSNQSSLTPSNVKLDGFKGTGRNNTDRLSGLLDGSERLPTAPTNKATSREQLNQFLDLPTSGHEFGGTDNRTTNLRTNGELAAGERGGQIYNDISQHLAGQPQPFTAAWYAQHPQAWQYTHPYADAWAVATWGAVTGWVAGVAATPVAYTYSDSVAYEESASAEEAPDEAVQASQANELAATPAPTNDDEPWLPLGVFALVEQDASSAQMLMQLSVSKSGHIGGSYYNMFSNSSQPIGGAVNKETQEVAWSVVGNDAVVFHTDLASLTSDEADVLIHFAGGETQHWTLVRLPADAE